jgi:hypothetical protein
VNTLNRRMVDLAFVTGALALIAASSHTTAIATIAALPLVLFLPGLALIVAVDPDGSLLGGSERYLWSIVVSIAVDVLGGLILNVTSSLDRPSWIVFLAAVTGVSLVVGWLRAGAALPQADGAAAAVGSGRSHPSTRWILAAAGIVILGFIVIGNDHQSHSIAAVAHKSVVTPTTGSSTTTPTTAVLTAQCEAIDATSTINFAVVALGDVTSHSSAVIRNVVVTWSVTYADRSIGAPTSTPVNGSVLSPDGSAPWGALATANDGTVLPTGVEITQISSSSAGSGTGVPSATCHSANATTTIGSAVSQDANGDYHVVALGVVTNKSSTALCDVVVTWTVSYADRTTGAPNKTLVNGAVIAPQGHASWGEQSTTGDGTVRPIRVEVTSITGVPEGAACTG